VPIAIQRIELHNVGSDSSGGVVLAELSGILMAAILDAVVKEAGGALPAEIMGPLTAGLQSLDQLNEYGAEVIGGVTAHLEGATQPMKEMGGRLQDQLQESTGGATEGIGQGLGGLLGREKKPAGDESQP
jgi:hypothetical protein